MQSKLVYQKRTKDWYKTRQAAFNVKERRAGKVGHYDDDNIG
jgi:hypothetical protein